MGNVKKQETVLTDPVLISIMLEKAKNTHSLLTVSFPDIREEFLSVITGIDENAGLLYIDELKPAHGNDALKKRKTFTASARLHGVSIGFRGELLKAIRKGSMTGFCTRFPDSLQHRERRSSHRVPVAIGLGVTADIYEAGRAPVKLRVTDISADGIGLTASPAEYKRLIESSSELRCVIRFPEENEDWNVRIQPCEREQTSKSGKNQFGACFLELTGKQKNTLNRQLRFFDRENIRKSIQE